MIKPRHSTLSPHELTTQVAPQEAGERRPVQTLHHIPSPPPPPHCHSSSSHSWREASGASSSPPHHPHHPPSLASRC